MIILTMRSQLNCVPYVLTCQHALCAYVPTCLACYVLMCLACLRINVPCVLTCLACLHANVPYVLTCLACLRAHVPTWFAYLLVNVSCVLKCSNVNVLMCLRANVPRVPCLTCQYSLPD